MQRIRRIKGKAKGVVQFVILVIFILLIFLFTALGAINPSHALTYIFLAVLIALILNHLVDHDII